MCGAVAINSQWSVVRGPLQLTTDHDSGNSQLGPSCLLVWRGAYGSAANHCARNLRCSPVASATSPIVTTGLS